MKIIYMYLLLFVCLQTLIGQVWHPPRQTVDIHHYTIDITLDEKQANVWGKVTYTVLPLWDDVEKVILRAEEMDISDVVLSNNEKLQYSIKGNELEISLGKKYTREDIITFSIHYAASPKRGIYFVRPDKHYPDKPYQIWTQGESEENHYWFPSYDYPNQLSTSEMKVKVRKPYIAIANGKLIKTSDAEEGWHTFHWKSSVPHVAYLVSLVVGDFIEVTDSFEDIPLQYYAQKKDADNVLRSFQKTPKMLRYFSDITGVKYAYEKYAQTPVEDFMWGGMENVSATTYTQNTIHDERAHLNWSSDSLVAHELAHQWWGDLLTCRDWSQIWLNEGFATYYTVLWLEHDMGKDQAKEELLGEYDWYIGDSNSHPVVWKNFGHNDDVFDSHAYAKGAWILHMLRNMIGHDDFVRATQLYLRRNKGRAVTTIDLQNAFEDTIGQNLDWFFQQWVYGIGHPKFSVNWQWNPKHKMLSIHVQQTGESIFRVTVPIEVNTPGGNTLYHIDLDSKDQKIYIPTAEKPIYIAFDKDNTLLKEVDIHQPEESSIAQLQQDSDLCGRIQAAQSLAKYPSTKAISALCDALEQDSFYGVRTRIAELLAKIPGTKTSRALMKATADNDARVRAAVVTALSKYSNKANQEKPEIVAKLRSLFYQDLSYRVQANALKSLAEFAEEESSVFSFQDMLKLLDHALKTDSHLDVIRRAALSVYADIDEENGAALLQKWYAYGRPLECRREALNAFFELKKEDKEEVLNELLFLLQDKDHSMRSTVISLLEELGAKEAIPSLINVAENDDLLGVQNSAAKAIKTLQGK